LKVFARTAVAVPVRVIELDKSHTAFDEAAGQQTIAREG
jgi:hypothetical protein